MSPISVNHKLPLHMHTEPNLSTETHFSETIIQEYIPGGHKKGSSVSDKIKTVSYCLLCEYFN